MTDFNLNQEANQTEFARLVGVSQQAISKLVDKGLLPRGASNQDWLTAYIGNLREQAAGRGGSLQDERTRAQIKESETKTANMRIQYHEKLGTLVVLADAQALLVSWASYANREFRQANDRLVLDIKSMLSVDVPDELRDKHVGAAIERVKAYALKLASGGSDSSGDVPAAKAATD